MRAKEIALSLLAGSVLALAMGCSQPHPQAPKETKPDMTVAPCTWWGDGTPKLPPYTYTDRCVMPNGEIDYAK